MKYASILILISCNISFAQLGMAVIGMDGTRVYETNSRHSEVKKLLNSGSLIRVEEKTEIHESDNDIDSEFNQFYWYKISIGNFYGWVYGNAIFHLDTTYDGRSEYFNRYADSSVLTYSIHSAMRHAYKISEYESPDPFSDGTMKNAVERILPWWGHSFLIALKHEDGNKTVDGTEKVLKISPLNSDNEEFKNKFKTDMLQVEGFWKIEQMFFKNEGRKLVITISGTDGQSWSSIQVYEFIERNEEFDAKLLFYKSSDQ